MINDAYFFDSDLIFRDVQGPLALHGGEKGASRRETARLRRIKPQGDQVLRRTGQPRFFLQFAQRRRFWSLSIVNKAPWRFPKHCSDGMAITAKQHKARVDDWQERDARYSVSRCNLPFDDHVIKDLVAFTIG